MNWTLRVLLVLAGLVGGACQTYKAMPLDADAVRKALEFPGESALRVAVRDLNHPLLKPVIVDLSDGISPDEAAVLAVVAGPALRAERDRRGLADAQVIQAGILPNPQVSAGIDVPSTGATAGTSLAYGVGLNWDVTSLIGRSQRIDGAKAQRTQVDLDVAWTEWQAAMAARTAVVRLVGLASQEALAADAADRLREIADRVRRSADAGQVTAVERAAAEAAGVQADATLLELRRQIGQQRLTLNRLLGLPPGAKVQIQAGTDLPARVDPPPLATLLRGLEDRRLDLVALRFGYQSQEAALHAAVLGQFPRINVGITQARDTSNVGTTGFGITIDLPIFDRNQGRIAFEKATRQQLFDEYTARVFEARADLADLSEGIRALDALLAHGEAAITDLERLAEAYGAALERGQADAMSAYAAWNNLVQKRIEVAALHQQLAEARIALGLAAGLYRMEDAVPAPGDKEVR